MFDFVGGGPMQALRISPQSDRALRAFYANRDDGKNAEESFKDQV